MSSRFKGELMTFFSLVSLLASLCSEAGCSKDRKESIGSGKVYISIFQPNSPKLIFEVGLPHGSVGQFKGRAVEGNQIANGTSYIMSCSQRPIISSPDSAYVAGCTGDYSPHLVGSSPDMFVIRDARTQQTVVQLRFSYEKIESIQWSASSDTVAVLTSSVRTSLNPKYWIYALSGHPTQKEKYRLEIVELKNRAHRGIDIPYESMGGHGEISTWLIR